MLSKIVSGGQTGADRAALDWAIANHIPHGGWCPKGRKAEDGELDKHYLLKETPSADYAQRTSWNIWQSDATAIFSLNRKLIGGSYLTLEIARNSHKPCLQLYQEGFEQNHELVLHDFLQTHPVTILNMAGSRESEEPGIYDFVWKILSNYFKIQANLAKA